MSEKIDALLTIDDDYNQIQRPGEATIADLLAAECKRYGYPFECRDINSAGWGDVMWIAGSNGCYSGEIKKAAELVGGLDHLEDQLSRQVVNCDHAFIATYDGVIRPAPDGNTYVYTEVSSDKRYSGVNFFKGEAVFWEKMPDSEVALLYRRRYFRQNYLGLRSKLARFYSEFGIELYEMPTKAAMVDQIISLYRISNTEGRTFSRLIPEKFYIDEPTQRRRDFMLTLMGIQNAGIGEEVADAIASWMELDGVPLNLYEFVYAVPRWNTMLAGQPLRSSLKEGARKRTIGPAKVAQIMKAVGL